MAQNETQFQKKIMVFFDGHCNLCNFSVNWLISRDTNRKLFFASLQGETAKKSLSEKELGQLSSIVVLLPDGQTLRESKAIFYLLGQVQSKLSSLRLFSFLPGWSTDAIYRFIARNRYSWFGRSDLCRLPTAEEQLYLLP